MISSSRAARTLILPAVLLVAMSMATPHAWAATTTRVSVSSAERPANGPSAQAATSKSGRFVAFASTASNLVPNDTNRASDVFVRDLVNGTTRRVSVSSAGRQGNAKSVQPTISANGRVVAFVSVATNLVRRDTNRETDVFVWTRGRTLRVSVGPRGRQANGASLQPAISADGSDVAFESQSTNLVPGDTNRKMDVFRHSTGRAGNTVRLSVGAGGLQANGSSFGPTLNANGDTVAFMSAAANLVSGDTNTARDVFVRRAGETLRVSVASDEEQGNADSSDPAITAGGGVVAFASEASNLVGRDTNGDSDVFVRVIATGTTEVASVRNGNTQNGASDNPAISHNGTIVVFTSTARRLVNNDTNGVADVLARNRGTDQNRRVSLGSGDRQANGPSDNPVVSGLGNKVAFDSLATNLTARDGNRKRDVFAGPVRR